MAKNNSSEWFIYVLGGLMIGIIIALTLSAWIPYSATPSQETLDEICIHITNNSVSEGEIINVNWRNEGDLKCNIPSYDHTQRIIVEKNNE